MKPACEIDEYARIRFTSRCASAPRFPQTSEIAASTATAIVHTSACSGNAVTSTRRVTTSAAVFVAADMNAVTEVGDALVHVRRPHVERRGRDLECEPGEDHREPGEEERVARRVGGGDRGEAQLPVAP